MTSPAVRTRAPGANSATARAVSIPAASSLARNNVERMTT